MGVDGKGGWDGPAIWPPPPSEEQLTVPRLTKDGLHIEGWCRRPTDRVWKPSDLLWLPPRATKSTDIDGIGRIVDVEDFGGIGMHDWVTAQLNKRGKYMEYVRDRVRAGTYRLTAALAKWLGMPFDEDGAELVPRSGTGTVTYKSLDAKRIVEEGRRLAKLSGYPIDLDTGLPVIPRRD